MKKPLSSELNGSVNTQTGAKDAHQMPTPKTSTEENEDAARVEPSVPRADRQDLPQSGHRATPGPWTCRESAVSQNGNLWFIDALSPAHQVRVAETWNESHARLIAAAPDLLESCKALCESAGEAGFRHDAAASVVATALIVRVRAAIAKAEGVS